MEAVASRTIQSARSVSVSNSRTISLSWEERAAVEEPEIVAGHVGALAAELDARALAEAPVGAGVDAVGHGAGLEAERGQRPPVDGEGARGSGGGAGRHAARCSLDRARAQPRYARASTK